MSSTVGYEVAQHRPEIIAMIRTLMAEHTARKGCGWNADAEEVILCDWSRAVERQEICKAKEAA